VREKRVGIMRRKQRLVARAYVRGVEGERREKYGDSYCGN
jgi:hypothetical protein